MAGSADHVVADGRAKPCRFQEFRAQLRPAVRGMPLRRRVSRRYGSAT